MLQFLPDMLNFSSSSKICFSSGLASQYIKSYMVSRLAYKLEGAIYFKDMLTVLSCLQFTKQNYCCFLRLKATLNVF